MWLTEEVNIPEPLIEAQREGTLVVFAGAGVSVDPPSNMPDFTQLAIQVGGGQVPEKSEPIDRFFGRLKKQGTHVHLRVSQILGDVDSKPTPLHEAILSLFGTPEGVRIVTTNFDKHFSTVAAELYQTGVEFYYAPALPLGSRFNGIVYLHGCVEKEPERLVLTDSDFGRAYLTEGWASRFLQGMFSNYTILFIGYSHDDPVMRYLARGLPADTFRYALTRPGQEEHWDFHGIKQVLYPLHDGPGKHRELGRAIAAWVDFGKMGALDHEQRIKEIVASPPPVDPKTSNYIETSLEEVSTVRFFTRYARDPVWLQWVEEKGAFRALFQPNEQVNATAQEIAVWFAEQFVCEYPNEALAVVQRQGQVLNPVFWNAIANRLFTRDPRPSQETMAKWVAVLLRSPKPDYPSDFLDYLLSKCQHPDDYVTALLLFEHLTKPRIELKPYLSFLSEEEEGKPRIDVEITIEGDEYWLKQSWEKVFRPNLADFYLKLEPILTAHLIQAQHLLRCFGKATDRWDLLSFGRAAIEPHEQNYHTDAVDTLIDAARDLIEWMLEHDPDRAHSVIETWSDLDVSLLRRLAIHGITESSRTNPDGKISWILDKDWLYGHAMKHEVFRLLKRAYPNASKQTRVRLLDRVSQGPQGQAAEGLDERAFDYEVYDLLYWLYQADPNCNLAKENFEAVKEKHPDFEPTEHPDLDFVMRTGWEGPRSPVTVEGLLTKNPGEDKEIEWLLTYQGKEFMGPDRKGLLAIVSGAVAQEFDWGWELAGALQRKRAWDADIWGSLLRGWNNGTLTEPQWEQVLTLLADHTQLYEFAHPIADLLENGIRKEQGKIRSSCLPLAERVADQFWDEWTKESTGELEGEAWLTRAINHPGGKVTEFWLHALSKRRSDAGEIWTGLPLEYKRSFNKVLSGESFAAELGRVVLASQILFLFSIDGSWARENILPLFDWSKDEKRALQAWDGYLVWGRCNEALLPEFLVFYEQSFSRLSRELSHKRELLCRHLANIAVYTSINPLEHGWLGRFLSIVDIQDRKTWAAEVRHQLRSLKEESAQDLWRRWMDKYWAKRITGIPVSLSEGEMEEMVQWAVELGAVFPAVVEKICLSPAPSLKHTFLYHELVEKEFATDHPISTTDLLLHLLPHAHEPFYHCKNSEQLVRSMAGSSAPPHKLLQVCDNLARLGCANASQLKELI